MVGNDRAQVLVDMAYSFAMYMSMIIYISLDPTMLDALALTYPHLSSNTRA